MSRVLIKKSMMKKIFVLVCVLLIAGCVEDSGPEAYDAVVCSCIKQGKVMYVHKTFSFVTVECVDP